MSLSMDSDSAPEGGAVATMPSILSANWLYLVSMLLILSVGSLLQNASFGWGLLATELLLILLPTLVVFCFLPFSPEILLPGGSNWAIGRPGMTLMSHTPCCVMTPVWPFMY